MAEIEIDLSLPDGTDGKGGGRVDPRAYRHHHPEREPWVCVRAYEDNTFDVERPEGWAMAKVPGIRPGLWRTIKAGMTVIIAWVRAGAGARQRPYVRGRSSAKVARTCAVEAIHPWPGGDWEHTGMEPEAGERPSGIRMDPHWQTDLLGNISGQPPGSLLTGRIAGRPLGWVATGQGTLTKRLTCFDLLNGETIWQSDIDTPTEVGQNSCALLLDAAAGELVMISQFQIGIGTFTLDRVGACTGEHLARTGDLLNEINFAPHMAADGQFLFSSVLPAYAGTAATATTSRRLTVYRRNVLPTGDAGVVEAYSPAYQVWLPFGGALVGTGAQGGAVAGAYWAQEDQAVLVGSDRQDVVAAPAVYDTIIRAQMIAWEVRSGRLLWKWKPHDALALALTGNRIYAQHVSRDPYDGGIYWTCVVDAAADKSFLVKISPRGETLWTQELDASGAGGKTFTSFSDNGIIGPNVLLHYAYNSGAIDERPILVSRGGGGIGEGPDKWHYAGGAIAAGPSKWIYAFVENLPSGSSRWHITDWELRTLVDWESPSGALSTRNTPDGGAVALFRGWIYGLNWDSGASGWRVRRWN